MAVKITCPYCNTGIQPLSRATYFLKHQFYGVRYQNYIHVGECPACRAHILVTTDRDEIDISKLVDYQPKLHRITASEFIPENIRQDFIEAKMCLQMDAIKAAAAMSRRALQSSALERKAPDKRLIEQLKWMFDEGIITKSLYNLAEKIRVIGNEGAHPSKDRIDEVKKEEAETIVKFLEKYLDHVYITPKEIEELEEEEKKEN